MGDGVAAAMVSDDADDIVVVEDNEQCKPPATVAAITDDAQIPTPHFLARGCSTPDPPPCCTHTQLRTSTRGL